MGFLIERGRVAALLALIDHPSSYKWQQARVSRVF